MTGRGWQAERLSGATRVRPTDDERNPPAGAHLAKHVGGWRRRGRRWGGRWGCCGPCEASVSPRLMHRASVHTAGRGRAAPRRRARPSWARMLISALPSRGRARRLRTGAHQSHRPSSVATRPFRVAARLQGGWRGCGGGRGSGAGEVEVGGEGAETRALTRVSARPVAVVSGSPGGFAARRHPPSY